MTAPPPPPADPLFVPGARLRLRANVRPDADHAWAAQVGGWAPTDTNGRPNGAVWALLWEEAPTRSTPTPPFDPFRSDPLQDNHFWRAASVRPAAGGALIALIPQSCPSDGEDADGGWGVFQRTDRTMVFMGDSTVSPAWAHEPHGLWSLQAAALVPLVAVDIEWATAMKAAIALGRSPLCNPPGQGGLTPAGRALRAAHKAMSQHHRWWSRAFSHTGHALVLAHRLWRDQNEPLSAPDARAYRAVMGAIDNAHRRVGKTHREAGMLRQAPPALRAAVEAVELAAAAKTRSKATRSGGATAMGRRVVDPRSTDTPVAGRRKM